MTMAPIRLLPLLAAFAAACASTTAPTPPPREMLLVVNGGENSLTLVPIDSLRPTRKIPFGSWPGRALDVAARGSFALVAGGASDVLFVVDVVDERLERTIVFPPGSHPTAVTFTGESIAYVAQAGRNVVTRIDLISGDTASVAVGQYPIDMVLTRGRLFVMNANVEACVPGPLCPLGPSWVTVIDPQTNARAAGRDSIPLPDPGRVRSADVGGDGLIYAVNAGDVVAEEPGRLTIIDPLRREEVGSFGGFGFLPVNAASDGRERLFIASLRDGLMEFNTRTRRVVRGAGNGVLVSDNVAAAVDSDGRVYALESGGCAPGSVGRLRLFRPDLTEARSITVGECPTAATIVRLPDAAAPAFR
jgi:hypothetical protein